MNKFELKKWQKTRVQGQLKYSIKTASITLGFVVLIYFFGNAYTNKENLEQYVKHNFETNADQNLIVILISYIAMIVASSVVWKINEARYKKAIENNNSEENKDA